MTAKLRMAVLLAPTLCLAIGIGQAMAQTGGGAAGTGTGGGYAGGMGRGAGMMGQGRGWFGSMDTNGDGMISREEFQAHVRSMFAVMDQNGDGKVTREEFMAMHMGPAGGYGPGYHYRAEAKARRFAEIDTNHDGFIDQDEFMAWEMARYQRADAAGKGAVTRGQLRMMDNWRPAGIRAGVPGPTRRVDLPARALP